MTVMLDCQIPNFFGHGHLASLGPCPHACLLLLVCMMLLAVLLLPQHLQVPVAQGITDGDVSGREGSQQDSLPGKAGTPHATLALWGSSSASAAMELSHT